MKMDAQCFALFALQFFLALTSSNSPIVKGLLLLLGVACGVQSGIVGRGIVEDDDECPIEAWQNNREFPN